MFVKTVTNVTEHHNKLKKRVFSDDLTVPNVNKQFNNCVEIIDKIRRDQTNIPENKAEQKIFTEIDLAADKI
jgi:hypothetical protein